MRAIVLVRVDTFCCSATVSRCSRSWRSAHRACCARAPLRGALAGELGLAVLQRAPEAGVLLEVTEVALHRLAVALERLLVALHLPGQPDDAPVGLELRERRLEQLACRRTT